MIAPTAPARPHKTPSSMNGPRTNQFVAPTSFITSISRRRAKIESRIVFAIKSVDAGDDVSAIPFALNALALLGVGLALGAAGSGITLRRFLRI